MSYQIKLPQFEGPFDLLLFFIERDELDIYDIPIAQITTDFLDYMHHMEQLDIEVASEFILVAATLMRIKAKMLLPRKDLDEAGNELDPRKELVQKLLEYRQFKEVSEHLKLLEEDRAKLFRRGSLNEDLANIASTVEDGEAELHSLNLYGLMRAFNRVLQRYDEDKNQMRHAIVRYPYTICGQKRYLKKKLSAEKYADFVKVFDECENRVHAVYTFLAMLELINQGALIISLREGFNNFMVKLTGKDVNDQSEED